MVIWFDFRWKFALLSYLVDWYDNEHAPERLKVPGILNAIRYKAADDQKPTYLALYDADSPNTLLGDGYKDLAKRASDHERTLIPKLELLNRRIYDRIQYKEKSNPVGSNAPFLLVINFVVPDELESEFNKWYQDEHADEFSKTAGWRRCRRYKLVSQVELGRTAGTEPAPVYNYLTLHEFEIGDYDKDPQFSHAVQTPWSLKILPQLKGFDLRKFALLNEINRAV